MCAIFGSKNQSMFEVLYEANKFRGVFASSVCNIYLGKNNREKVVVKKTKKEINFDIKINRLDKNSSYFLGHVQAPTSKKQTYDVATSHPFETEDWVLAHNGVLTNFKQLNDQHCKYNINPVDTSVIINMLQDEYIISKIKDEVKIISKVLSRLEGTFACYIVNRQSQSIYIVRQGSTLFFNEQGDFSSIKGISMKEVPEGEIYKIMSSESVKKVGMFKVKSPFLVI